MASLELRQSWQRTEDLLKNARAKLDADAAFAHGTVLLQMTEFLEHNELGLAFDLLKSIAEESQWEDIELLNILCSAARNMDLVDEVDMLNQRIAELG